VVVVFATAFLLLRGGGITLKVTPDGMDRGAPPILELHLGEVLKALGEELDCRPGNRNEGEVDVFSNARTKHCKQRHLALGNMVCQLMEEPQLD
jgi:hypothetical protein